MTGKRKFAESDSSDLSDKEALGFLSTDSESDLEEENQFNEESTISEIERIRLKNIKERNKLLRSLGVEKAVSEVKEAFKHADSLKKKLPSKKKKKKIVLPETTRRSRRLLNRSNNVKEPTIENSSFTEEKTFEAPSDTRKLGNVSMLDDEEDGFLELESLRKGLKSRLEEVVFDLPNIDSESFRDCILSLKIYSGVTRLVSSRVQSLCVHPSTSKRVIFAGSTIGSIGILDLDSTSSKSSVEVHPHQRPVNCLSVCLNNPCKLYSTSHDGTLVCADIEALRFNSMYATDFYEPISHLTWHHQVNAHTFLISHGNGSVGIFDARTSSVSRWIKCFQRSARTVQAHPFEEHYFLVSSSTGCGIFDSRGKNKSVCDLGHKKGLTSAFFSPLGQKIVTTCNDDYVRIYKNQSSSRSLDFTVDKKIVHNNHTGRWLSVFKAQFYSGRDDVLHIGSLLNPRRIQMYDSETGTILTELRDDSLLTVQSVIATHPSLPLVVGGNSTGRVHPFTPPPV